MAPTAASIAGRHAADGGARQAGLLQALKQASVQRLRRKEAFRTAAQDGGVAGLQAQGPGVGRDIGAAFVDDSHYAERRRHAFDQQPVWPLDGGQNAPDRIRKRRDLLDASRDRLDPVSIEPQTIERRRGEIASLRVRHIASVRLENVGHPLPHGGGRGGREPQP